MVAWRNRGRFGLRRIGPSLRLPAVAGGGAGMLLGFLLKGMLVGVVIALPAGPVGVLCIRRTIFHGRLAGFISGLGAATADAVFGIIAAFTADPLKGTRSQRDPDGLVADYASAFALTITNPITILAFLAIFASIGFSGPEATLGRAGILVLGVWFGSLLWWAGLAFGAGRVRLSFSRKHLVWINRGSGGILVFCGVALLGSVLAQHFG